MARMAIAGFALILVLGCGWLAVAQGPPNKEVSATSEPEPFAELDRRGIRKGEGKARIKDGQIEVTVSLPEVLSSSGPAFFDLMLDAPKDWTRQKIHANLSFDFPYRGYLRAGQVTIESNLPGWPAHANVDKTFLRGIKPRSDLQLEFELLAWTWQAKKEDPLKVVFMVRARLVRYYCDAELGFALPGGEDGPTWAKGTPVYASLGGDSKQVGLIEARPSEPLPWAYVLIDAPPGAEEWFRSGFVRGGESFGQPKILRLSAGTYEQVP
ncbi:MAG: hypothetical protein IMZ65_01170 [Planctomycetes bacterium]|nr:hypothetical protein [Planctomycetota bacterium]